MLMLVDLFDRGMADADLGRVQDQREQLLAAGSRQLLRIVQSRRNAVGMQTHGGGGDGAGQRAAPGLVHADDDAGPVRAGGQFKEEIRFAHAAGCPDAAGNEKGGEGCSPLRPRCGPAGTAGRESGQRQVSIR